VVDALQAPGIEASPIVLVVGFGRELVENSFEPRPDWIKFAIQEQQLGTGHAIDMAREFFEDPAHRETNDVLVLCGDGPLIRPETLQQLHRRHIETGAAATLATAILDDASGYGRIQRSADGSFDRIVEQKDATPEQLELKEVNPSYYIFRADALFDRLGRLGNQNASGEYYITDVFEMMKLDGLRVEVVDAVPSEDVLSINTLEQLSEVEAILAAREATHEEGA
jgi:bifunctional UDP-N-acetylglucosamine pyrophosphorylase/glucosamine-1-phosphate N-acetyltransferase